MAEKPNNGPNRRNDYGSSNRRKFLIGAGSVAAGSSALLGTAATTTFNLNDRAVSANVVTDSDGAVALTDTEDTGNIVNLTNSDGNLGSGELEVDFTQGGAGGVNLGSIVTVGNYADPSNEAAFTITNQTTDDVAVDIEFEANAKKDGDATTFVSNDPDGSTLQFKVENVNSTTSSETSDILTAGPGLLADGTVAISFDKTNSNGALPAGSKLDVAMRIDTDNGGSSLDEDLSGVLNIKATQQG